MIRSDSQALAASTTSKLADGPGEPVTVPGARVTRRRDALANRERLLVATVIAMRRDGLHVPMSKIANEAGVGVGTLYRHYPDREALLDALTERSFDKVRALAEQVAADPGPAIDAVDRFLEGTIAHRDQLLLPLHGGPPTLTDTATRIQESIVSAIETLLERGRNDATIRSDVMPWDVIMFGAMLAEPLPNVPEWDEIARRQKAIFLSGLSLEGD